MVGPEPRAAVVSALLQGLRELGYVYGEHFVTEARGGEARPERFAGLVGDLVRLRVNVIVAPGPMLSALVLGGGVLFPETKRIADLGGHKSRLPAIYSLQPQVEAGGLMSYGADIVETWRRAAAFVDKVLKGANPASLPVEQPSKFELVINLKAAQSIGLEIPQSLLLRAEEVLR